MTKITLLVEDVAFIFAISNLFFFFLDGWIVERGGEGGGGEGGKGD